MRRFDNTLERSEEERLNLELFLTIPQISVRALQGGGEVQVFIPVHRENGNIHVNLKPCFILITYSKFSSPAHSTPPPSSVARYRGSD